MSRIILSLLDSASPSWAGLRGHSESSSIMITLIGTRLRNSAEWPGWLRQRPSRIMHGGELEDGPGRIPIFRLHSHPQPCCVRRPTRR